MATFLKDGVYVYIARENALNDAFSGTTGKHLSTLTKTGVQALGASTANQVYQQIEDVTGVSIGGYGLEYDTFQTLADNFDHDIEIKRWVVEASTLS